MTNIKARVISECNSSRVTFPCAVETPSEFQDLLKFVEEYEIKLEEENKSFPPDLESTRVLCSVGLLIKMATSSKESCFEDKNLLRSNLIWYHTIIICLNSRDLWDINIWLALRMT